MTDLDPRHTAEDAATVERGLQAINLTAVTWERPATEETP